MVTTSQHASPTPSIHPLEVVPDRTAMFPAPQVGLHTRTSLGDPFGRPLSRPLTRWRVINGYPVLQSPSNGANRSTFADTIPGTSGGLYRFPWVPSAPKRYLNPVNTLPQSILQRIFDFYADSLRQDTSRSPFATPETLLQVCKCWKDAAECHESIWTKVYITLIDEHDVGRWIPRIKKCFARAQLLTDISIQDQRDLTSPRILNTGADLDLYRQLKTRGFLAHLKDIALLTTELHSIISRCRYKGFRLSMPPSFVEIVEQLDDDARLLASSLLNRIFHLDLRFLESLELENVAWITPTARKFNYQQLPPIFQGLSSPLKVLRLYNCFLPKIPNLDKPCELYLEHCFQWNPSHKQWESVGQISTLNDLDEVKVWMDLQKLTIGPLTARIAPFHVASLHTLEIIAWWGHESTTLSHI
ncbi:SubName: Full=Uncharacterized protein {ECO:0000313/EMBL:CCA74205.1} [Serendipita indica DSM 11827]|nr:SubName: Full=Uncharacterized protein {ECO:0000313/EMBL:CCA74205.1} [Serendipita indica DSM 11827]